MWTLNSRINEWRFLLVLVIAITVVCSILPPLLACSFCQMFAVQLLKAVELAAPTDSKLKPHNLRTNVGGVFFSSFFYLNSL